MKLDKHYGMGTPLTDDEALDFMAAIDSRGGSPYDAVFIVDKTNELITNKSIGLLQVDSILAAVAAIFVTQPAFRLPASVCLLVALLSCGLLLPNLRLKWAADPAVYRAQRTALLFSFHVVRSRAKLFTWALWLSYLAFLGAVLMSCYSLWLPTPQTAG